MARLHWPGEDPLVQRIRFRSDEPWHEVIGVVGDIPYGRPRSPVKPEVYVSLDQHAAPVFWLLIRARSDAGLLKSSVTERIRGVDPLVPILDQRTMAEALASSIAETRYLTWALTALAVLAVSLCAAGVFAVSSHSVARRTFELGVRTALGARAADIWFLVTKRTLFLTALGIGAGAIGSSFASPLLASFLFGVERRELTVLLTAALVLTGCSVLAVLRPAQRAIAVDPSAALRHEEI